MRQFFLYVVIGSFGASLDLLTFNILYILFDQSFYLLYHVIGYLLGTIISFILNYNFNFKVVTRFHARLTSFLIIGLLGLMVSSVFIITITFFFNVDARVSKLLSLFVILVLQYLLNKKITFNRSFFDKN